MRITLMSAIGLWLFGGSLSGAERIRLVEDGRAVAVILHGKPDQPAASRLNRRLREWTGAEIEMREVTRDITEVKAPAVLIVGSRDSNSLLKSFPDDQTRLKKLGQESFLIKSTQWKERPALILAGGSRTGTIFAVGEFLHWHLQIDDHDAFVESLDVAASPALAKRLVWTSVGGANWAADHEELHEKRTPVVDANSYRDHTRRMIDFLAEHKFNGAIFWGFAGDNIGGVPPARQMSRYAKNNGIRILPLIGTGIYGGFYHGEHEFNIATFARQHPEARCQPLEGKKYGDDSIAACHPDSVQFFREGAEWMFTTFPDIGGVNLENGDWMSCWNEPCAEEKAKPENDPNFYWDMMASQRDIIEVGLKHQPDAWMTFATYTPFTEELILRDLRRGIEGKLAKGAVYPPRFLDQVDPRSIAQWTVSGMNGDVIWPDDATPNVGRLKHHVAFTHLNSYYGQKYEAERWWTEPNATFDEASPILFFQIPQAIRTGFEGFVVKGFIGDASPMNELFYLAFEELTWHPDSTQERFFETRLVKAYGGVEQARLYLRILRDTTKQPAKLQADLREAKSQALATGHDPRVARRWHNLASELKRRAKILQEKTELSDS